MRRFRRTTIRKAIQFGNEMIGLQTATTETRLLPAKTLRFIEFLQEQLAPPPAG